jgi:hypothetical protein
MNDREQNETDSHAGDKKDQQLVKPVSRGGIDEMTAVAVRASLSAVTVDLRR